MEREGSGGEIKVLTWWREPDHRLDLKVIGGWEWPSKNLLRKRKHVHQGRMFE